MPKPKISGSFARNGAGPLILLFSQRARIRDVLTVGLVQSDYQIIQADASYLATIKAYQFIPDLIIADITADNTKDILFVPRLKRSIRTKDIAILLIMPKEIRPKIDTILTECRAEAFLTTLDFIEYPFSFADLQKRVSGVLAKTIRAHVPKNSSESTSLSELHLERLTEKLYDLTVSVNEKLRDISNILHKQWVFPFTVIRALDIIESEGSCCNELATCISTDQGAAAAILKVANTINYAKRGKSISEVNEAVVRLGFRETRNLLACLALIDLSPDMAKRYGFSRQEFWLHSLAVALIAEKLCEDCGYRRPELGFIAGLVHDLGKIPLDNNFNQVFSHLLEDTANMMRLFCESEEHQLGFTHSELGHHLANSWNFPSSISLAILNHHNPSRILATTTPLDRIVQEAVYVGNIIAKAMNLGHSCDEFIEEIPQAILTELKLTRGISESFLNSILKNLSLLCEFLKIPMKDVRLGHPAKPSESAEIMVIFNKKISFHPICLALANNGYRVRTADHFGPDNCGTTNIVISISEKGMPLDIMLFEDGEQKDSNPSLLKIFLLDILPGEEQTKSFDESNIIFINRRRLDARLIIHTIDRFLEKIVVPEDAVVKEEPVTDTPHAIIFKARDS